MLKKTMLLLTLVTFTLSVAARALASGSGDDEAHANIALNESELGTDKDFAGLVAMGGERQVYMACRGKGRPTVVLISGAGTAHQTWTHLVNVDGEPTSSDSAVFPRVAEFTRVCAYDRPGTFNFDATLSSSTPVRQPTTAQDGAVDLNALLAAAGQRPPYVMVGWSWGGLIARQYTSDHPDEVSGLVLVDPASEFLQDTLTPTQWGTLVQVGTQPREPESVEGVDYGSSAPMLRAASEVRRVPSIVLTSDVCFEFLPGEETCQAWQEAQDLLVARLGAEHLTRTDSDHAVQLDNPELVIDSVLKVVADARK